MNIFSQQRIYFPDFSVEVVPVFWLLCAFFVVIFGVLFYFNYKFIFLNKKILVANIILGSLLFIQIGIISGQLLYSIFSASLMDHFDVVQYNALRSNLWAFGISFLLILSLLAIAIIYLIHKRRLLNV